MKNESATAKKLDQYYTNPSYAKSFLAQIDKLVDLTKFDHLLEPSAGTGSFFNLLDESCRIGLDLEPKADGVIETDFFDWFAPIGKSFATIGNPPFGKNANLAIKFFNKAAMFSDVIAFVVPRTFRKASVINRLNKNFHLIYDETVPDESFIFNNKPYDVWCCSQIWVRKDVKREPIPILKLANVKKWFEIVPAADADFAIQRVGGGAGEIKTSNFKNYSPLSNYFIKAHRPEVLNIFKQIDFSVVKFNTAGNPSVSANEMISLWIDEAKKHGINYDSI